jgi:hypothetical protein
VSAITETHHRHSAHFNITVEQMAGLGVYLFALSWPLGAYQRVLGPVHLHHIALIPIFWCVFLDLKRHKRWRTPFELWWPCAVICLLTLVLRIANPLDTLALCSVFVAVSHVVRNRQTVLRALHLSVLGAFVMMLLSLLAQRNLIYPTVFNPDTGMVMSGPYSLQDGLFSAVACALLVPGLLAATRRGEYTPGRLGNVLCILLPVMLGLFCLLLPRIGLETLRPGHGIFLMPTVLFAAIVLWGSARITAKLWIARKFMMPGVYSWLIAVLVSGTLLALWVMPFPSVGIVFLAAVIAGYGQPYVSHDPGTRLLPILGIITAGLVLLNLVFLFPGDPRNYERFAQTALANNDTETLHKHLAFVTEIAPEESRAHYYRARAHLADGNLYVAAQTFAHSLGDMQPRLLPAPDKTLVDEFLNEMRDISSAMPEKLRGLAYEQALIAAGRERHALSLLELRGDPAATTTLARWPLAAALATLLDAPQLLDTLKDWDSDLLAAILESAGPDSTRITAPEGFPASLLPLVAMAQINAGNDSVQIFTPAGLTGGTRIPEKNAPDFIDIALALSTPEWQPWRQNAEGVWRLAFGKVVEIHIKNGPEIFFGVYPVPPEVREDGVWKVAVFMPNGE